MHCWSAQTTSARRRSRLPPRSKNSSRSRASAAASFRSSRSRRSSSWSPPSNGTTRCRWPPEAGGEGLEPPLPGPKPGVLPTGRPPSDAPRRISERRARPPTRPQPTAARTTSLAAADRCARQAGLGRGGLPARRGPPQPTAAPTAPPATLRNLMAAQLTALIMAAGHGTRMRSSLPKVLHPVCGVPMVEWVIDAAHDAGAARVVCITRPETGVADSLPEGVEAAEQTEGEGTGSAVLAARDAIAGSDTVIILSGDVPLTSTATITSLLEAHQAEEASATLLTTEELDPTSYGRIVRAAPDGPVQEIVETKDPAGVPAEVLAIREINVGTYVFDAADLLRALEQVPTEPNGERYLTSVFPILREQGKRIVASRTDDVLTAMGVNTRADLMEVTRHAQRRVLDQHALGGVTFTAPDSVAIDKGVTIGNDTTVHGGVTLRGNTIVGERCDVGPATTITNSYLGDRIIIPHSFLVDCRVADDAKIGPFAYLRPEADIRKNAKVGTFVEVKKSTVHEGAKVPHLSYIGDADVGADANLGAGTITANYHRGRKTRTTIGEGVHTGVHTALVAPVNVGDAAYTGAGSVITKDVPDGALAVSRPPQRNIEGYSQRMNEESEQK